MGFGALEQWWEAWQLRILVLGSVLLQFFLMVAAALRRRRMPPWFKLLTWVAYQGSDALAFYALATLFSRHGNQDSASPRMPSGGGASGLEALWAPILLFHLGGQDGIIAYSIQDIELWQRHFVIAASQIVVAVYVFRKSWPRGDRRLLEAAILLFIPGTLKCLEKPFALWRARLSSMAVHVGSTAVRIDDDDDDDDGVAKMMDDISLDEFVKQASLTYCAISNKRRMPAGDHRVKKNPYRLFVDVPYRSCIRLANLKYLSKKRDQAHSRLRSSLSKAFNRLYTNYRGYPIAVLRAVLVILTFVAIRLFNLRHRGAYDDADLKVTYVLLSCNAALECISTITMARCRMMSEPPWPDQVAQCNLLAYVGLGKKHRKLRMLASLLGWEGYLDQLWCTGNLGRISCMGCLDWLLDRLWCTASPHRVSPPPSPEGITELVHDHISAQWREHINSNAAAYRSFSDSRGQWTVEKLCRDNESLSKSLQRPFDESIVLWHLATEIVFFDHINDGSKENSRCREISNYMVYLLLVRPEMLLPSARRQIFWTTYDDVVRETQIKSSRLPEDGEDMARKMVQKVQTDNTSPGQAQKNSKNGMVQEARDLAQELIKGIGEEGKEAEKMWKVIRGVWVEMLCFSAGRCSGYLHAKTLGTGGEFLSYVWLLREYMGMRTLAEIAQRRTYSPEPVTFTGSPSASPEQTIGCWYFDIPNNDTREL